MGVHTVRLVLGVAFLIMAAAIFARDIVLPGLAGRFDDLRLNLGGALALIFGCMNIAKWYVAWSYRRAMATPVHTPLQRDPSVVQPEPYNPDLDFTRPSDPEGR